MAGIDQKELWFATPDSPSLCRAGGNGPNHPSQLYAIKKYLPMKEGFLHTTFLDYGAGSATTYEALKKIGYVGEKGNGIHYRGLDVIKKNTEWCQQTFPEGDFKWNPTLHKIDEPNKSWDVVYSRHVVDHMKSFEDALDEHCRVAKKLVIIVLWVPMATGDEHDIKNIVENDKVYENEYTNSYSESLVMKKLHEKIHEGWKLKEITKDVGSEVRGHDTVIVLERR